MFVLNISGVQIYLFADYWRAGFSKSSIKAIQFYPVQYFTTLKIKTHFIFL